MSAPAPRSRSALDRVQAPLRAQGLYRARRGKLLAGVLVGLARRFGVSPWLLRLVFVVSVILPGPQALLYLVLWILMPQES